MALGGIGAVIILLVWGIIATLPKKEDGREEEVRLRSEIKDNFTLKDMLGSVEKEMENRRENRMPGGGNYGMDEPEDTVSPESEIQRIRELIRRNEQTLGSGPLSGTEQPAPSAFREKETTDGEEEKPRKTEPEDTVPEETPRRGFNSVRLVRQDERNVIRAFVHSTQTVMVGATLKMQLAENCLTDDGQRIRKGTPVFGEVTGIDGERVLVKITSVNLAGNILPFEKEVYSEDAMEGIYVPGNAKAETIKEAEAAGVSGTNTSISGGLDKQEYPKDKGDHQDELPDTAEGCKKIEIQIKQERIRTMAKVYVASSWSNEYQPRIVAFLREREHEVYDFRNPERKTDFRWSQISGNWEKMETDEYLDALEHPLVEAEFRSDFDAMRRADICVLVLPCGASAHSEAGWMKGTGKKVIVYQNRSQRPELMYKLFDGIFPTVADVTRFLKEFDRLNNLKTV